MEVVLKMVNKELQTIAIRRAALVDADKVRYRVYRAKDDFVAVIAESALMAMKVSGITEPYRIVRDLPNEGVAIEAQRMAKFDVKAEKITLSIAPHYVADQQVKVDFSEEPTREPVFTPMQIRDIPRKDKAYQMILPPEMMHEMNFVAPGNHRAPAPKPVKVASPPPVAEPQPHAALHAAQPQPEVEFGVQYVEQPEPLPEMGNTVSERPPAASPSSVSLDYDPNAYQDYVKQPPAPRPQSISESTVDAVVESMRTPASSPSSTTVAPEDEHLEGEILSAEEIERLLAGE